jgi:30S ribosomal protein S31
MGKGDQKSRRGKIWKGSYGVRRPHKSAKVMVGIPDVEKPVAEEPTKKNVKAKQ